MELTGYAHRDYARSLAEFGVPLELPASGGWLLRRPIGDTGYSDAMGPYPLFCCQNWSGLRADLDALARDLVSVVLVSDPFGKYDEVLLRSCFDHVAPFKTHFVIDTRRPGACGKADHRRRARKALRHVSVEICADPAGRLAEWVSLYDQLIRRHTIIGIQAFSLESFRRQFAVPGLTFLRALSQEGECIAGQLWYAHREVACYHLGASNSLGYEYGCSYALFSAAIDSFQGKVRWLDLGGGAGYTDRDDGLTQFKRGWSNDTRPVWLCGRVLNMERYIELTASARAEHACYFPAYRCPHTG